MATRHLRPSSQNINITKTIVGIFFASEHHRITTNHPRNHTIPTSRKALRMALCSTVSIGTQAEGSFATAANPPTQQINRLPNDHLLMQTSSILHILEPKGNGWRYERGRWRYGFRDLLRECATREGKRDMINNWKHIPVDEDDEDPDYRLLSRQKRVLRPRANWEARVARERLSETGTESAAQPETNITREQSPETQIWAEVLEETGIASEDPRAAKALSEAVAEAGDAPIAENHGPEEVAQPVKD